jgi:hypothetical protein
LVSPSVPTGFLLASFPLSCINLNWYTRLDGQAFILCLAGGIN